MFSDEIRGKKRSNTLLSCALDKFGGNLGALEGEKKNTFNENVVWKSREALQLNVFLCFCSAGADLPESVQLHLHSDLRD